MQAKLEHTKVVVMADMNAKVGNDDTSYKRAMGKEGCVNMSDGIRLLECCITYDLVIRGTLFSHLDIHKRTWYSLNGKDKNRTDNLMINGTWKET